MLDQQAINGNTKTLQIHILLVCFRVVCRPDNGGEITTHVRVARLPFSQAGNNWQCGSEMQTQEVILGSMLFLFGFVLFFMFLFWCTLPYPIIRYYLSIKKEKERKILGRNAKRKWEKRAPYWSPACGWAYVIGAFDFVVISLPSL